MPTVLCSVKTIFDQKDELPTESKSSMQIICGRKTFKFSKIPRVLMVEEVSQVFFPYFICEVFLCCTK